MNTPEGWKLDPCPFCGGEAEFERVGTPRWSCIVACRNCGARHESSDENERSGMSWNSRAAAAPTPPEQPNVIYYLSGDCVCELSTGKVVGRMAPYHPVGHGAYTAPARSATVKESLIVGEHSAAQPEPSACARCGGLVYDPLLVQQPEPGGLTDAAEAECAALSAWDKSHYAFNAQDTVHPMFLEAFKLGFSATRKRPAEEVARIMEAVDRFAMALPTQDPWGKRAEVERLLKGEA